MLLTAGHAATAGDRDGALLCDADLAVLAARAGRLRRVRRRGPRRSTRTCPTQLFRAGRAAVLRRLLELPALFRLPDWPRVGADRPGPT